VAERLDVADAIEDVEQHRVVEPLELVSSLGPAARALFLLLSCRLHPTEVASSQAHRSGSGRGARMLVLPPPSGSPPSVAISLSSPAPRPPGDDNAEDGSLDKETYSQGRRLISVRNN
jgi:hypothetical protein